MAKMIYSIKDKIEEYGVTIFKHHKIENDQYVFFCDNMVIFIYPDENVSVAFQATTKPEEAANSILILQEIPNIEIEVMEAFIYCDDNKLVSGEEAYELIKDTIKTEGAKEYMLEEAYSHLLKNATCHEC